MCRSLLACLFFLARCSAYSRSGVARRAGSKVSYRYRSVRPATAATAEDIGEKARCAARIAVLGCAAVYGTNFAAVKTLDSALTASLAASLRFGLASIPSATLLYALGQSALPREEARRDVMLRGAWQVGCVNAVGYVSQSLGLESVDASLSAFICSLAVVVVPALDAVLLGRTAPRSTWLGASLAALGVALLSLHSLDAAGALGGGADAADSARGLAFTCLQPICFGYGFWRTERIISAAVAPADESGAALDAGTASLMVASAQLCAVKAGADLWLLSDVFVSEDSRAAALALAAEAARAATEPNVLAAIAWTGAVTTFATVLIETVALSKISAQESTVLFATEPLWAAAFAALALGERLDATSAFGGLLVVAACLTSAGLFQQKDPAHLLAQTKPGVLHKPRTKHDRKVAAAADAQDERHTPQTRTPQHHQQRHQQRAALRRKGRDEKSRTR